MLKYVPENTIISINNKKEYIHFNKQFYLKTQNEATYPPPFTAKNVTD